MTIGIIEDDTLLHQALKTALRNAGYQTVSAYTKQEALTAITGGESLLLIDIGLPDGNGIACYKKIRENAEIPAIFLTARDEETDMLTAFDTGADDYVVKPFYMGELLARIRVAKRLSKKEDEEIKKYQKDYLDVDFISRKVLIDQEEIHLTPIEFNLLKLLIEHRGKVLTHNYIQKEIWGYQDHSNQNALRVFMATLRRKIEKDTNHPHFIVTEVGVGYYFKD